MIRFKQAHKIKAAFTLVEVLLGLLIFSIIAVTVYNVFWLGIKVQQQSDMVNKNYQEAFTALQIVSKDIQHVVNYDFSGSWPQQLVFNGTADQVSFLVRTPEGISHIRFYLNIPDLGRVMRVVARQYIKGLESKQYAAGNLPISFLIREEVPLMKYLSNETGRFSGEIVAGGIKKSGMILHYGSFKNSPQQDESSKQITWQDEWHENALPVAIRVELELYFQQETKEKVILRRDIYLPPIEAI